MAPPSDDDQTALGLRLRVTPAAAATPYHDGFGNRVDLFTAPGPCRELTVRATGFVRTHRRRAAERLAGLPWPGAADADVLEYLRPSRLVGRGPAVEAFVAGLPPVRDGSLEEGVKLLMAAVAGRLTYEKQTTTAQTPVEEALALGRGVCQDFAHLFLAACRGAGLPARYVSGYVHHPGEAETHAWCQVWAGPAGWVDVDPTRGLFPEDGHVVTAVGRDYADVPPNRGAWKGDAAEGIAVKVTVEPVQRLPADWGDLASPPPPSPSPAPAARAGGRGDGLSHQAPGRPGLRQQQSQQQQGRG
jgi:transglutaminase-like putative cysteine protease